MRTIEVIPAEPRVEERREQPRHSVLFRTVVIDTRIDGQPAEIVNIARLGFLARTEVIEDKGNAVRLDIPTVGPIDATVVWCGNGMLGGRFSKPMSEAVFSRMLQALA